MKKLYNGRLPWSDVPLALSELEEIQARLERFEAKDVVWDIEDLGKRPPWGDNISAYITNLPNYFITRDGRDLFEILRKALRDSISEKTDIEITSLQYFDAL